MRVCTLTLSLLSLPVHAACGPDRIMMVSIVIRSFLDVPRDVYSHQCIMGLLCIHCCLLLWLTGPSSFVQSYQSVKFSWLC